VALLIALAVGASVALLSHGNAHNAVAVRQLSDQLEQTKTMLVDAMAQLSYANKKLGFLDAAKVRVEVTAYALTDDFGPNPLLANNGASRVPAHTFASLLRLRLGFLLLR
jgi:hypothetical protein